MLKIISKFLYTKLVLSLTPEDLVKVNKKLGNLEKLELIELLVGKRKKRIESLKLDFMREDYGPMRESDL